MSIYQTSKGKVIIARLNAQSMAPMFEGELSGIMLQSAAELEDIISRTLSRLANSK